LDFWEGNGVNSGSNEGKIASLQVPLNRQGINSHQWGEASFTGPSHDIIVCDVNGKIMFFQFERENNVNQNNVADLKLTLVEVGTGTAKFALEPGFGRYFDPIFAWGELALRPIMVTTDVDGKDSICVLTVPDDSESEHLQIREDTVIDVKPRYQTSAHHD